MSGCCRGSKPEAKVHHVAVMTFQSLLQPGTIIFAAYVFMRMPHLHAGSSVSGQGYDPSYTSESTSAE